MNSEQNNCKDIIKDFEKLFLNAKAENEIRT